MIKVVKLNQEQLRSLEIQLRNELCYYSELHILDSGFKITDIFNYEHDYRVDWTVESYRTSKQHISYSFCTFFINPDSVSDVEFI